MFEEHIGESVLQPSYLANVEPSVKTFLLNKKIIFTLREMSRKFNKNAIVCHLSIIPVFFTSLSEVGLDQRQHTPHFGRHLQLTLA